MGTDPSFLLELERARGFHGVELRPPAMNTSKAKSQPPFILSQPPGNKTAASAPMTVIIADDEPNIARHLQQMLGVVAPGMNVVAVAHDGQTALDAIMKHGPTLVFLDIHMPGLDGIEVAWQCRDITSIIFVTAFEQHAVTAFEQGAVDYLLKPITPERLGRALQRFYERQKIRGAGRREYVSLLRANAHNQTVYLIPEKEILYIEAMGNYCVVHAAKGEQGNLRYPLTQLKDSLNPEHFVQIHRGCIINKRRIQHIVRQGHGAIVQLHGCAKELRASRQYMTALVSDAGL